MAQDYDKIFKENIEKIIIPLIGRLLHIYPEKLEEIAMDVQRTSERKPDYLKKVSHIETELNYVLHIEFQTEDDYEMVYRMHEYYGMLLRKHKLKMQQYVFFLGKGSAKMPTQIEHQNLSFRFNLINMQDIDYHSFINSETPEEAILAILGNFGNDSPEIVVQSILRRIKDFPTTTLNKEKCLVQLEVLSILRKLQPEIIKQIENMPLLYDITKDLRYLEGFEKAQQEAEKVQSELQQIIEEAQKEAINAQKEAENAQKEAENAQKEAENAQKEAENAQKEIIKTKTIAVQGLLSAKLPIEQIATLLEVSIDFVQEIANR